jgi:hypothetical protein
VKRINLEYLGIDGRVILKWIFKRVGGLGLDFSVSRQEQVAGCLNCRNEPLDSSKCGEFIDLLRTC